MSLSESDAGTSYTTEGSNRGTDCLLCEETLGLRFGSGGGAGKLAVAGPAAEDEDAEVGVGDGCITGGLTEVLVEVPGRKPLVETALG